MGARRGAIKKIHKRFTFIVSYDAGYDKEKPPSETKNGGYTKFIHALG